MFKVDKILCPTDFSEPSKKALEAALEMSSQNSAELVLVHVVPPLPVTALSTETSNRDNTEPVVVDEIWKEARKNMNQMIRKYVPDHINHRSKLVPGDPADEIVHMVDVEGIDMIVMSTAGVSGWRRLLFGSVAEKVVRSAECPVLTIRKPEEEME